MVLGKTFVDLHIGVSRWREVWTTQWNQRAKGVWDSKLQRETLVLKDGRHLSYFLDGPKQHLHNDTEIPYIFCYHAMFLTGNSFLMTDPPTDYILVCINRPGYFGSDPVVAPNHHHHHQHDDRDHDQDGSYYTHRHFCADMAQLADHLQVQRFYVAGHSSGGPCALACAAHLPLRVIAVGLLSSDPEYAHASAPDKKWINACCIGTCLPLLLERLLCCLPLARHSAQGLRNDYRMDTARYSFDTESDIRQPVLMYVGQDDQVLPVSVSQHVQARLNSRAENGGGARLHVVPKVGHLGLLRDEVLADFFESLISMAPMDAAADSSGDTVVDESDMILASSQLVKVVNTETEMTAAAAELEQSGLHKRSLV